MTSDTRIYFSSMSEYIDCNCSRWDVSNYTITFETWLDKDDLTSLRENIVPGAVGELYSILGRPTYYDKTWESKNTIKITPNSIVGSNIDNMRSEKICYVKNITTGTIDTNEYINVKLECFISGMVL